MKQLFQRVTMVILLLFAALWQASCEEKATLGSGTKPNTGQKPSGPDDPATSEADLIHFPAGKDPRTVGDGVAWLFAYCDNSNWGDMHASKKSSLTSYPDVCAWLGAFWYAEATDNQELFDALVVKFEDFRTAGLHTPIPRTEGNAVDYYVFGAIPLHIYAEKKRQGVPEAEISHYLEQGLEYADGQWELPSDPKYYRNISSKAVEYHNQGYSYQTRLWIDDMFMITALQAQAYLATGDEKYIKRAAEEMMLYLDRLPGDQGLYYHAASAPFFWARGNGWMAAGMPEMLRMLPQGADYDRYRQRILAEYQEMMASLLKYQYDSGMWGQLIYAEGHNASEMWEETSGSAMFTYAMILGVKNGWLDAQTYGAAARKGWLALQKYLLTNYEIQNVCCGTGIGSSYEYYRDRDKLTGDLHGQAAMMWCAYALVELANEQQES